MSDTLADLIRKAERILVIGLRGAYPLAYYLSFYLKMIRDRVTHIGQAGHTLVPPDLDGGPVEFPGQGRVKNLVGQG